MPKDTFYNLTPEKKQRIFDAAVKEFSTRRFSEASLNQIVKSAGIAWGSFYQYFEDKEDIYLYMLQDIAEEKRELLSQHDHKDADFFETLIQQTKDTLELGRNRPEYTRIGMLMEIDNSEVVNKLRAASIAELRKKLEHDKERGLMKPDTDTELVANLMFTFTLAEYFRHGLDENMFLNKLKDVVKIIKEGISTNKDQ